MSVVEILMMPSQNWHTQVKKPAQNTFASVAESVTDVLNLFGHRRGYHYRF